MTQPPEPPPPPDDAWPTPDDPTVVSSRETVVGGPTPDPVGPPPDRRIGAGMLLALGALALVAAGIAIAWYLTHRDDDKGTTTVTTVQTATTTSNQVAVPDLTGRQFDEAQAQLDALGLSSTKKTVTSGKPAGTVVEQQPQAGASLAKGSEVTLSVAKGPSATTTAKSTTTTATTTEATTTTATTTTSATTTAPAQPTTAKMPDVTGQTEQAAVTAMSNAGVLASIVFVPAQDPLGTVVQQAKPGGTTVPFHAHVQINVSNGPNGEATETVPDAIGKTLDQAVETMNGAHLRLIYVKFPVTSQSQAGKIVQQSPLKGAKAPQNAQVLVYLGALQKQ